MDFDGFQSLNDQLCRNNRCNGDKEPDATDAANLRPSRTKIPCLYSHPTRETLYTTARSLNRDAHSVKAELARMIYHVDGDDNDTAAEG